jgi:hypothetical protein
VTPGPDFKIVDWRGGPASAEPQQPIEEFADGTDGDTFFGRGAT